jgi:uncharacterized protein with beta-barrel porin domain
VAPRLSYTQSLDQAHLDAGALTSGLELTWFAGLDFLYVDVDGYTETAGAGLGLTTQASHFSSLLVSAGVEASRPVYLGPNILAEAYGSVSLSGELLDNTRSVTSSFTAAGLNAPSFVVSEEGSSGLGGRVEIGTRIAFRHGDADMSVAREFGINGVRTDTFRIEYGQSVFGNDKLAIGFGASNGATRSTPWQTSLDYELNF